jgi:predicted dehydrogenase
MNDRPRADSSVLWDWLPHDLSMAHKIFGRSPDRVIAWAIAGGSRPVAAVSKFQFGDTPVVCTTSWLSSVQRKRTTVACEEVTLVFDNKAERQLALYNKNNEPAYPEYSDELPLTREMSAFLQAVRSGRADPRQAELGTAIVRGIAAAEESIGSGGKSIII